MFTRTPVAFQPGLYANRSRNASKQRWVDGNLVRFTDGVPAQVGGWQAIDTSGATVAGLARGIIGWRPNDQGGRFAAIGTDQGCFLFDGDAVADITPAGFVPGLGSSILGDGYGSGAFGADDFGTPRPSTTNTLDASVWTFDMFGEMLIACFSADGSIYHFTAEVDTQLQLLAGAPKARAICVSDERHVFAFGIDGFPNRVAWSEREDPETWDPLPTNRAGSYDVQCRSPFQCGKRVRGSVLGWTKTEVFAFSPLSNSLVYSRDRLADVAGCVGPNAVSVVTSPNGESAFWMGTENFFVFDGFPRVLPCELHDYVFKDFNRLQGAKVHARMNTANGEVWFWYCSAASDEIDRAVIYSYVNDCWSKASVSRLCWLDSGVFEKPIALDAAGVIYNHEIGDDAAGAPMPSFVVSHPITLANGDQFADVDAFFPDMEEDSAACAITLIARTFPGSAAQAFGPFAFDTALEMVPFTVSAREIQLRIDGNGGFWELGLPMLSVQGGSLR